MTAGDKNPSSEDELESLRDEAVKIEERAEMVREERRALQDLMDELAEDAKTASRWESEAEAMLAGNRQVLRILQGLREERIRGMCESESICDDALVQNARMSRELENSSDEIRRHMARCMEGSQEGAAHGWQSADPCGQKQEGAHPW